MQPIINYVKKPAMFMDSLIKNFGQWLPDSVYIKLLYRFQMGKWLNLKDPKTFQEKLQWLKLHDRNPEYTNMVDKYAVKEYVANIIGDEYIIPTLGVWDKPEDIEWDMLPNQFVLKTTHSGGSTGVVICKDKSSFNKEKAITKLNQSLKQDVYRTLKEWPYKNVPHRIIAEKYIDPLPDKKDLPDYKWYCFNGEPKFCQVIQDRTSNETIDFFDTEWRHQSFVGLNPPGGNDFEHAAVTPERPDNLETQIRIASELSKKIPFSRIDLFEIGRNIFFGEITFYPASGIGFFKPDQYNEILGEMLTIPGATEAGGR